MYELGGFGQKRSLFFFPHWGRRKKVLFLFFKPWSYILKLLGSQMDPWNATQKKRQNLLLNCNRTVLSRQPGK